MSRRQVCLFVGGLLLAVAITGCAAYNSGGMGMNGAAPNISQLMPNSAMHGSGAFPLTVNGSNFGANSVVYFNMNALQTAYVSTAQLTVQVPQADVASSGMVQVYVLSNGQSSNIVLFNVQ